jgi:hypothetical protein
MNQDALPSRFGSIPKRTAGIYLVDNKQGGHDFHRPDVYCAELNYLQGFVSYFLNLAVLKAVGAATYLEPWDFL